ncbi:MAG: PHP-associated domain-containing protein [Anaeromyxobacteraceae bacterium]
MLIDVHVHSHHTPGCTLAPRDVVRRAKEVGLDGVVFTDLNNLDGLEEIRAAGREESFLALVGTELTTDHGHYLCYFPDPAKVPAPPQMFGTTPWPVRDVLRRVRELGAVVVAAHPYDKTIERPSGDFIFTLEGLDALEGLNARRKGPANDLAIEAADHMTLPCVGASGAQPTLDDIGKAATLFRDPVATEADLVRQIRAHAVFCVAIGAPPPAASDRRGNDRRGPERHGDRDRPRGGGGGDRRGPRRGGGGRDRDRR